MGMIPEYKLLTARTVEDLQDQVNEYMRKPELECVLGPLSTSPFSVQKDEYRHRGSQYFETHFYQWIRIMVPEK